jgi:hypothetical protein
MAIVIPGNAVNYPNALLAVGLKNSCVPVGQAPVNGPQCVPVEVDWGTMGGSSKIAGFNIGNAGGTRDFSDICAIQVDNSQCGADIEFIFTDTQTTYTVPAYSPYVLIPVFTKAVQFYCVSMLDNETVESTDISRFTLFNFVPPPVVLPALVQEQNTGAVGAIAGAVGTTQIVAAGINGSLNAVYLNYASPFGGLPAAGEMTWKLVDGSAKVLWTGQMGGGISSAWNVVLVSVTGVDFRFTNGISFVQTLTGGAAIGGAFNVVLGYRQP